MRIDVRTSSISSSSSSPFSCVSFQLLGKNKDEGKKRTDPNSMRSSAGRVDRIASHRILEGSRKCRVAGALVGGLLALSIRLENE